jgi:hypothetical protein
MGGFHLGSIDYHTPDGGLVPFGETHHGSPGSPFVARGFDIAIGAWMLGEIIKDMTFEHAGRVKPFAMDKKAHVLFGVLFQVSIDDRISLIHVITMEIDSKVDMFSECLKAPVLLTRAFIA